MKTGISITQMAELLQKQMEAKKDFVAPTKSLLMLDDAKTIRVGSSTEGKVTNFAERQLAAKLEIPVTYYDRLRDNHPALLAHNVNTLFQREPKKVMVRTLDDGQGARVRAILSDRYRPLDNYDLFRTVAPQLIEAGAQIESTQITETKMYIKALAPWLDREVPLPPGMAWGQGHNQVVRRVMGSVVISGSDVGAGKVNIQPGIYELACTNMAIFREEGFAKLHIGKAYGDDENVTQYLSNETREKADEAVWMAARDILKATLEGKVMDNIVAKMVAARGDKLEGNLVDVVEVFATKNRFSDNEKKSLLDHLVAAGEPTRYGLQWAVTRLAGDDGVVTDYDRATELERLGGSIIELPQHEWRTIAKAA